MIGHAARSVALPSTARSAMPASKRDAQIELAKLIAAAAAGTLPDPSKTTVGEYLLKWIDGHRGLSGKTAERYRQLIVSQIIPQRRQTVEGRGNGGRKPEGGRNRHRSGRAQGSLAGNDFCAGDQHRRHGDPIPPNNLSRDWRRRRDSNPR